MFWIVLIILLLILLLGPQLWTQAILKKYSAEREDFPGTGGEFALHLIDKQGLSDVSLEASPNGDHYDSLTKTVRLVDNNIKGKSLTAVVVAAHEIGHAIQHQQKMALLLARPLIGQVAFYTEKLSQMALLVSPLFISFAPGLGKLALMVAVLGMLISVIFQLVTLPIEIDASFNKALPILKKGAYINERDYGAAKKILLACALTYVAGALASLLNVWRWLRFIRR